MSGGTTPGETGTPQTGAGGRTGPTIYDVARLAGVSPSTVSRALNVPGRIAPRTERRVREAAQQLDYQANPIARALHTGRTRTIGLTVADITNPVFFEIVRGAENTASALDYTLVLVESEESPGKERVAAQRLLNLVDCAIFAMTRLPDAEIRTLAGVKPVVLVNRELPGIPSIVADLGHGIAEAVRHLAGLGHRSIAYLAGPGQSWMSRRRGQLIEERASWCRMSYRELPSDAPTIEGGRTAASRVRDSGATAVIAYNDLLAIGLMQELALGGVSVPEDIGVVGFDDIFGADFASPPLTTIRSPLREQGELAVRAALEALDAQECSSVALQRMLRAADLRTTLVVRRSVAGASR